MSWHEHCEHASLVTTQFSEIPLLDDFPIWDFELKPDTEPYLLVSGYLSALPDQPNLPEGQIADKTDIGLAFIGLRSFSTNGLPTCQSGRLKLSKDGAKQAQLSYESPGFTFSGECDRIAITYLRVLAVVDSRHIGPRGPRLFSHVNVWNTCLLLMQEYGYSLRVSGHSAHRGYISGYRWYATKDDRTELFADNPIELLGLVDLHRHHQPDIDQPHWWRIEGPSLTTELIDAFDKQSDPRRNSGADARKRTGRENQS